MTHFHDSNMDKYMEQVKTTVHFIYWHVILCDHRANLLEGECRIPTQLHKMIWNVHTFVADFNIVDWRHFLPEASFGLRVLSLPACVCVCVCLSVNHHLVRAVTHQPFKLESPNLDQRCKRPWLRSLLFFGMIDLELQSQIELKSQNLPHFELVRAISHHKLKSVFPNFGQKCILALLRSLLILGWIDLDVLFYF